MNDDPPKWISMFNPRGAESWVYRAWVSDSSNWGPSTWPDATPTAEEITLRNEEIAERETAALMARLRFPKV